MNNTLLNELKSKFGLSGTLSVLEMSNNIVIVKGEVISSTGASCADIEKEIVALMPGAMVSFDLKVTSELTLITNDSLATDQPKDRYIDEVNVAYYGELDINLINDEVGFKTMNERNYPDMKNIHHVLNFLTPIVLDSKLRVIDGALRLRLAKDAGDTKVLVVIVDDHEERAEFLRLALNRTSEFQRWNYDEVDEYVDAYPQVQPILEPIGFFGNKVLPESFFAATVLTYELDPFNLQQTAYSQDVGLAEFASIRRKEIEARHKANLAARKKPKRAGVSLFDLQPQPEDFLEVHDIAQAVDEHVEEMKEVAGVITDNYDVVRKAEIEARGGTWQGERRSTRQVAEDKRNEYIAHIKSHNLSPEQEELIMSELDEISSIDELENLLVGVEDAEHNQE